ncbi:hypothetical protein K3G69_06765 [Phytobacter diazotrophicus]|uniref:hypothetical protein n=1 Tax=Phytobacter diazotrophicus TaxID=395631 RepID=UPI001C99A57D|nr:hypothetical protein [Phytobacter diazotrophicus]MBY6256208.1 hypothetical protein [Phytobacter diazotrophicus]
MTLNNNWLNKKNVELNISTEICCSNYGHRMTMRADGITSVSRFHSEEEKEEFLQKLERILGRKWKQYRVERKSTQNKAGKPHPYKYGLSVYRKDDDSPMLLHINWGPRRANTGGIRFEFRPQHMDAKAMDHMLGWLSDRFGAIFYRLLARSWVTRIDVALDVYGCKLNDYVWDLKGISAFKDHINFKGLPGLNLGGKRSELRFNLYEKVYAGVLNSLGFNQRSEVVLKDGKARQEQFIEINQEEFESFLRIEARIMPGRRAGSWSVMLAKLAELKNPFGRIVVYKGRLKSVLVNDFIESSRPKSNSAKAWAKHAMGDVNSRMSRRLKRALVTNETELFNKGEVWAYWPSCVAALGEIIAELKPEKATKKEMAVSQFVESKPSRKRNSRRLTRREQARPKRKRRG